jgi:hypothetical protein
MDKSGSEPKSRSPDILLASEIVQTGITACINEYRKWNKDTPESSGPTIEYLNKAVAICNEIGFKSRMNAMEKELSGKREFIGIWEELNNKNLQKFKEFISEEKKVPDPNALDITIKKNDPFEKEFDVIFSIGDPSDP